MTVRVVGVVIGIMIVASLGLSGCGDGGDELVDNYPEMVLTATIEPAYLDYKTINVDTVRDACDAGPLPVFEPYADHSAAVRFDVALLNPHGTMRTGRLIIERYTIEYRRSKDSLGAPVIESDNHAQAITLAMPIAGSSTATTEARILLMDTSRKDKYAADIAAGASHSAASVINRYTVIYTFYGKSEYGKDFILAAASDVRVGNFNNCP
jgi:hypothetical protein